MKQFLTPNFTRQKATAGTFLPEKLVSILFLPYIKISIDYLLILVADEKEVKKEKPKEEPSSHFQRQRVDMLLGDLLKKFPIPQAIPQEQVGKPDEDKEGGGKNDGKSDPKVSIKQEPMDTNTNDSIISQTHIKQEPLSGPPEKKSKANN